MLVFVWSCGKQNPLEEGIFLPLQAKSQQVVWTRVRQTHIEEEKKLAMSF